MFIGCFRGGKAGRRKTRLGGIRDFLCLDETLFFSEYKLCTILSNA